MAEHPVSDTRGQGEGARLKEGPAPELMQAAFRLELADAPILWRGLSLADLAHIVMLREMEIAPATASARLLRLLLELHDLPLNDFSLNPALEDVYSNREAWLRKRDEDAAGWMGAGRPRREPATIAYRIAVRERLLSLAEAVIVLGLALAEQADTHATTVMPDYTYLQHAQPTSLGHYLLSFVYPLVRDLDRLQTVYERTNQSPAGIGSINGSRLPVNRQRLAELLGFDSVIVNTRDAMWQVDTPVELASLVTMLFLHLDRLAEDLQIWNTAEFDLVELADRHARISLIMPQKKNPYSLAFVRGMTGHLLGKMVSFAAVGKTPSAQMDNRIFIVGETPRMLDHGIETVRLMAGVVTGLTFNMELMAQRAGEGYAQATDLAEAIMEHAGLNYRTAHRIVGLAIRLAMERREKDDAIPSDLLDTAARQVLDRPLALPPNVLNELDNPRAIVATRQGLGGAAEEPVRAMLTECRTRLHAASQWKKAVAERLDRSEKNLLELAATFAAAC
ncbi:MAG: argininosuccinate lyase [Deltaproteobacteria bacterium]|nr:argininosuccinate lyase [Deltaproteobacteria bacterium]